MFNRRYIFKWSFFHCHISFRGCNLHWVKDLNQRSQRIWGNTFIYDRWKKREEAIKPHPLAGESYFLTPYISIHQYPEDPWDWYIYLCIYHKHQLNVGKYTIHGSYGIWYSMPLNTGFQRCWHGKTKAFSSAGNLSTQHIRQFSFYTIPHPQRIYVWYIYLYIYHKKPNHYFGKYTIPMDPMDGSFRK